MDDPDVTMAVFTRLRLKGFPVALDDFGTGHSSLTALRRMPFSAIKIDKSFVGELQKSSNSFTIVKSVIQLARDMRLESVAEGVENAEAARLLTELGIDHLQGYYFSPPRPFDGFAAWLRTWSAQSRRSRTELVPAIVGAQVSLYCHCEKRSDEAISIESAHSCSRLLRRCASRNR